jgi:cytochrome c oxidase cbb3-type subunit 3
MKKVYLLMCFVLVAAFVLPACKKKEEAPPAKTEQAAPMEQSKEAAQPMEQNKEAAQQMQQPAASTGEATAQGESGADVYNKSCASCHASGVAGAPKVGDTEAWKDRIAQGMDTLYNHAIEGFNSMPAKGGDASLTDDQVKSAVDYMVSQSK